MVSQLLKKTIQNALDTSYFYFDEIHGGFSKQVYKITTQDNSFILYIWRRPFDNQLTENQTRGIEYLFPDGFSYYIHNTKMLTDMGIRVPYILTAGHHDDGDFDYAIVECFKGISINDYIKNDGNIGAVADKITAVMDKLAVKKRTFYGPPLENKPNNISTVQLVFDFTLEELNIASKLDDEVSAIYSDILNLMRKKKNIIKTNKQEFSLIHGELTPDHIFILENGEIGLIDIDGVKYFDIEYDWGLINLIYEDRIPLPNYVNVEKLDFYKLCWIIIYVSGAIDYLVHVDSKNEWFINFRKRNLRELNKMI